MYIFSLSTHQEKFIAHKRIVDMKKEIFAGTLLTLMLIFSICNINWISNLVGTMTELIENAQEAVQNDDWDSAVSNTEKAAQLWKKNSSYTHIVMSHNTTTMITDDIYDLLSEIYSHESDKVAALSQLLTVHLHNIIETEQLHPGSIF